MSEEPIVRTEVACVVDAVARYYGVGSQQVYGRGRSGTVATARAVSIYLVRMTLGYSYPEIARLFGSRNHSTIISAVQGITAKRAKDEALDRALDVLRDAAIEGQGKDPSTRTPIAFPDKVWDKLQGLLDTGMFGKNINDVVVRLVSEKLFMLTKGE